MHSSIGLGILSWRARKTLQASLESHREAGVFGLFDEAVIFFNEIEEEDRALAAEFGLRAEGAGVGGEAPIRRRWRRLRA